MRPVVFKWIEVDVTDAETGEVRTRKAMVPLVRFDNLAASQYADGEEYPLVPVHERSKKTHSHFFAVINDAYDNLPEKVAARWPNAEHFRKWLLIEAGWFHEKEIRCADETNARRLATFIRVDGDEFARIFVVADPETAKKTIVIVRKAMSQDHASMDKVTFQKSKTDVLDLIEQLIGVSRTTLNREAGRSA